MEPRESSQVRDRDVGIEDACPMCGSQKVSTREHREEYVYGTGDSAITLLIDLPVHHCESCHFEYFGHDAERLIHDAVCRHLGVLNPEEVRDIRRRYGMSRSAFARVTGLGEATIGRWEAGSVIQNRANDRYLRLLDVPSVMQKLTSIIDESRDLSATSTARIETNQFPGWKVSPDLIRQESSFVLCPAA